MNKVTLPTVLAALSLVLFYCTNKAIFSVGKLMNAVVPCKQDAMTSYPCYAGLDITSMFLYAALFVVSMAWMAFQIFKSNKP